MLDVFLRLLLAVLCGGLVGIDREHNRQAAGFRTHILVSVGSALVMIIAEEISRQYPGSDPARMGAQVISGIGFLGAGTIIRRGANVRGLTTAASLWAVSCIGLAAGNGRYLIAVIATVLVFVTLMFMPVIERVFTQKRHFTCQVRLYIENGPEKIGEVSAILTRLGASPRKISFDSDDEDGAFVSIDMTLPKEISREVLTSALSCVENVEITSIAMPR